jgi:hypothetical protein
MQTSLCPLADSVGVARPWSRAPFLGRWSSGHRLHEGVNNQNTGASFQALMAVR